MAADRSPRTRLARALAAVADIGYQAALAQVAAAAEAGRLPALLDRDGIRRALDLLLADLGPQQPAPATGAGPPVPGLELRYHRLCELSGVSLDPAAAAHIEAARALGVAPAACRGGYDPVADLGALGWAGDDPDRDSDWWRRTVAAGERADVALACPYPPGADADGFLPVDRALDARDTTGDLGAYEQALHAIVAAEPRDIDAFAHLGHLLLAKADPGSHVIITPAPGARQRRAWLRAAVGYYQAGIGVGELALPEVFTGVLLWTELDNRPFFRALHGMALALWRLGRFDAAALTLLNMLWLNPADNQGARLLLPTVQARQPWEDHAER
jgi:hypothetical protein